MDGLTTLREIRKRHPGLRTIMFSTLTTRGASSTFEALSLGADDYVAKASNAGSLDQSLVRLRGELIPKIRQFFGGSSVGGVSGGRGAAGGRAAGGSGAGGGVGGNSTGGGAANGGAAGEGAPVGGVAGGSAAVGRAPSGGAVAGGGAAGGGAAGLSALAGKVAGGPAVPQRGEDLFGRRVVLPQQALVSAVRRCGTFQVLGIGVSTGGPQALAELIPQLPAQLRVPVLIVQHMPPMFTRLLAERLDAQSPLHVVEAADGMELRAGNVYLAPGDYHLRVRRRGGSFLTVLDQEAQENSCRPSVDVLFRALAEGFGKDVLSVVLTGMGSDGLRGTQKIKAAGGYCLVQDQASSVVWGMPGAVAEAGIADGILPLSALGAEIARLAGS